MRGSAVLADLAGRLGHDVRLRYPGAKIVVSDDLVTIFFSDDEWYGEGRWVGSADELSPNEAEAFIAETAGALVDNGWPDEEAWPVCPTHRDHPLQVAVVRGTASWVCAKDHGATAFRLGDLAQ